MQSYPQLKTHKPGQGKGGYGICLYGRSGVGKTSLLGTLPGKGLVIDVPSMEGGTEVLDTPELAARIDIHDITAWDEIEEVHNFIEAGKHGYNWVAFDSITAMKNLAKRKAVKGRSLSADPKKVSQQDFGVIGELGGELIIRMRSLPILTIWIAQEKKNGSDEDDNATFGPAATPMILETLLPAMKMVIRLYVARSLEGVNERQLLLDSDPRYFAKTRAVPSVKVPQAIRNPNLGNLLYYLRGDPKGVIEPVEDVLFVQEEEELAITDVSLPV